MDTVRVREDYARLGLPQDDMHAILMCSLASFRTVTPSMSTRPCAYKANISSRPYALCLCACVSLHVQSYMKCDHCDFSFCTSVLATLRLELLQP